MAANSGNPLVLHPPYRDGSYAQVVEPGAYTYRVPAQGDDRNATIDARTLDRHTEWTLDGIAPMRQGQYHVVSQAVALRAGHDDCFTLAYLDARVPNGNTENPHDYYPGPYLRIYIRVEF